MTCYLAKAHNSWSSVIYTTLVFVVYLLLWKYSYQYHEKCYWSCMSVRFAFSPHNNHFFNWSRVFDRAWLWSSSGQIVDLQCGTIILFPFSRDWLISFILEREFEIAPKLQPPNKRLCDLTWKSRETGRFLLPIAYRVFRSEVNFIRFTVTKKPECR